VTASTRRKSPSKRDSRSRKGTSRTNQKPGTIRYGCEIPRIFTPPLRELTPETSLGFSVIEFANVLGIDLYPWQRWLLIHMLEVLDDEDRSLRFGTVVVLVARQNGKSALSQVLALWMMMALDWPVVLGTAQDIDTAEKVWSGAVDLLESDEELAPLIRKINKTNGKKSLVLETGNEYRVKSANRRAGRGFSGNLILLDELREHQNWFAWAAITHTTMAQLLKLIVCLSNAGDATSVVLAYFRKAAHRALGDPDGICEEEDDLLAPTGADLSVDFDEDEVDEFIDEIDPAEHLGFFEWSAAPGKDRRDRDGWAQANPSMGHIPPLERNIAQALSEPEWVFRTEVLCQWPDGSVEGPFLPGSWEKGRNTPVKGPDGKLMAAKKDRLVGPVWACIDTSFSRSTTYIVGVGHRADGVLQGELWAARAGNEWVQDWLLERTDRIQAVTGQSRGAPVSKLMKDLAADRVFTSKIPVIEWAGGDLGDALGEAFDAVKNVKVRHNPQKPLDVAASASATQTLGAVKVIDRKASPVDAAPLVAFVGALWLARRRPAPPPPPQRPPELVTAGPSASRSSETNLNDVGF